MSKLNKKKNKPTVINITIDKLFEINECKPTDASIQKIEETIVNSLIKSIPHLSSLVDFECECARQKRVSKVLKDDKESRSEKINRLFSPLRHSGMKASGSWISSPPKPQKKAQKKPALEFQIQF